MGVHVSRVGVFFNSAKRPYNFVIIETWRAGLETIKKNVYQTFCSCE